MASIPTNEEHDVNLARRLEILKRLEEGVSVENVAIIHGVSKATVQRYRRDAQTIQLLANPRKGRRPRHHEVEKGLCKWFLERRALGATFTDGMLMEKARQLQLEIGGSSDFWTSRSWLWCFKKRYNIRVMEANENTRNCDKIQHVGCTKQNESIPYTFIQKLSEILIQESIDIENVYKLDTTSLLWRNIPEEMLMCEIEEMIGGVKSRKSHVTVGFCANATGTHKLPLLFVNKCARPRAIQKFEIDDLPVVFKSQENAQLDIELLNDWYNNHFKPSVEEHQRKQHRKGKVLLFIDNCKGDTLVEEVSVCQNFKLIYLPATITSQMRSMEKDVVIKCKTLYRYALLWRAFEYHNGYWEFYVNYTIKDCMDLISGAWNDITGKSIKNSWKELIPKFVKETFEDSDPNDSDEDTDHEIKVITGRIPIERLEDWLLESETAESELEEKTVKTKLKERSTQPQSEIEEEEMDLSFYNLAIWAKTQPEVIKYHVKLLVNHYNQH